MSQERFMKHEARRLKHWQKARRMGKPRYILVYGLLLRGTIVLLFSMGLLLLIVQPSAITSFVLTYVLYAFFAACSIGLIGATTSWRALEQRFGYDDKE